MKQGDRVFVEVAGKAGELLGWREGQWEVRLEGDPDYVSRWFCAWDVEAIEPYEDGDPEAERLAETGKGIIDAALSRANAKTKQEDEGETNGAQ